MPTVGTLFTTIYSIINTNVTNPHGSTKWIFSTFPLKKQGLSSDFPIIVIEPISVNYEPKTLSVNDNVNSLVIKVFDTKWASSDSYMDLINTALKNNKASLNTIHYSIRPESEDTDDYPFGSLTLHMRKKIYTIDTEDDFNE